MAELHEGPAAAHVERFTIAACDGIDLPTIRATPDHAARAGIVLHPDLMGIRPLFDDLCRRVATHGYEVLAPEPFARAPDAVRNAAEPATRIAYLAELDDDLQLDDLDRAASVLRDLDSIEQVHVMGFCMGGMQTFKAAATGAFDRAVAFYGMIRIPIDWRAPLLREPLTTARDVCPTLAVFGAADLFTPSADIDALRRSWKSRPDCKIVVYRDAEHGFVHVPDRPAHRAGDAADAWHRALEFLALSA